MILRAYKNEDAEIIAGWIRTEDELYKWSADRFNKYPLSGDDVNENYAPQMETGRFIPLTAAVGFKAYSKRACEMPIGTWSCTDMELILDAGR